jgi:hypothetical protein
MAYFDLNNHLLRETIRTINVPHSSKAASTSRAFKLRAVPMCLTAFDGKCRCDTLLKIMLHNPPNVSLYDRAPVLPTNVSEANAYSLCTDTMYKDSILLVVARF